MKTYVIPELLGKRVKVCEEVLKKANYDFLKKYVIDTVDEEIIGNVYYDGEINFGIMENENTELDVSINVCQDGTVYFHASGKSNGWIIEAKEEKKWKLLADNGYYLFSANINLDQVKQIPDTYYINLVYRLPATSWNLIGELAYGHLIGAALEDFVDDVRSFSEEYQNTLTE